MVFKAPESYMSGVHSLPATATMEAEPAAAPAMGGWFFSYMTTGLGFGQYFGQVPLKLQHGHPPSSATAHSALAQSTQLYASFTFVKWWMKENFPFAILPQTGLLIDIGTKYQNNHCIHFLIDKIQNFGE